MQSDNLQLMNKARTFTSDTFAPATRVFAGTQAARQAFDEEFAGVFDADWTVLRFGVACQRLC